ncbi:MAG: hypothetical protein AAF468_11475 [Pseudomonadota bacterium]
MAATPVRHSGKTFSGGDLELDAKEFHNCTFNHCNLIYRGGLPPAMSGCSFNNCGWQFGDDAARTLGFLSGLYGGGFDVLVEQIFHQIRKGETFANVPNPLEEQTSSGVQDKTLFGFKPPRILKVPKKRPH